MRKKLSLVKPFSNIVWGVDALYGDFRIQKRTAKAIASLTRGIPCKVEPVCIFARPDAYLVRKGFSHVFETDAKKVKKNLRRLVKEVPLKGLKPVTIRPPSYSIGNSVKSFLSHAKKQKADLIVVSTHAREGMNRFLMGSFAETLFLQSSIPVFAVNPKAVFDRRYKSILFPTDFSEESMSIFERVLSLAKHLKAKVHIYHKVEFLTAYSVPTFHGVPTYQAYMETDIKRRYELADQLKQRAEAHGVKAEVKVDQSKGYVEDTIIKAAKKVRAEVIAMASQSGPITSFDFGECDKKGVTNGALPTLDFASETKKKADSETNRFKKDGRPGA